MVSRLPRTLLNGRLRTTTVLLSALFVGLLVLYLQVRPVPVSAGDPGASTTDRPASTAPASTTPSPATTSPTPASPTPAPPTSAGTSTPVQGRLNGRPHYANGSRADRRLGTASYHEPRSNGWYESFSGWAGAASGPDTGLPPRTSGGAARGNRRVVTPRWPSASSRERHPAATRACTRADHRAERRITVRAPP